MNVPAEIRVDRQQKALTVRWHDDHVSVYPFRWLRERCECAACKEEWTGKRLIEPGSIAEDITIQHAELVGNYALRIRWSDGHDTGLYTWEHLLSLCRCTRCTTAE